MANWFVTPCPLCNGLIDFCASELHKNVECPDCNEVFNLVSLTPLRLAYAHDLNLEPNYFDEDYPRS